MDWTTAVFLVLGYMAGGALVILALLLVAITAFEPRGRRRVRGWEDRQIAARRHGYYRGLDGVAVSTDDLDRLPVATDYPSEESVR